MTADKDGQVFVDGAKFNQNVIGNNFQWLITARKPAADGKADAKSMAGFAYLGFTNVWVQKQHDQEYEATRVFGMTDRPVYRPDQQVDFKFWVRHSKYDMKDVSTYANQVFTVRRGCTIRRGRRSSREQFTADEYGGLSGAVFSCRVLAPLGQYNFAVVKNTPGLAARRQQRTSASPRSTRSLRVRGQDRRPHPSPSSSGDKITATVDSRYYFDAPVTTRNE